MSKQSSVLDGYLSEAATAKVLGRSTRTLAIWRARGEGPPFTRIGLSVFYRTDAIASWLKASETTPVRSGAAQAAG